jgi:hypothetical protein
MSLASLPLGKSRTSRVPGGMISRQARISQAFKPGSICAARVGSEHAEIPSSSSPRNDLLVLGVYEGNAAFTSGSVDDGTGGATNADGSPAMVQIRPGIFGDFQTGTSTNQILAKHVDQPCFMYDDDTVYLTSLSGTLSFAGFVDSVNADGTVRVRMGEDQRVLYELYNASGLSPSATSDDTVRAVATSFPAGTFSGGVLTLTATGAFSTAQDGVTLAVGDKFILPAGTITTLVVSAANSGPYEVTSLGATGVSATFTRPARWTHGATITPETKIKVGGEGTLFKGTTWTADPATATKVVGTDDPVLYPDRVTQQVTLASSTVTITNVPIKSASKSNVLTTLAAAGGTQTSTVAYGPIVAPTPGGIGTASLVIDAIASGQTKNGTADTSTLNVTIFN